MKFEMLDSYLLDGTPSKGDLVRALLKSKVGGPSAAPFYAGLESLGSKAPDLALIALRLVLAGKKADDASVVRLRELTERVRAKGPDEAAARGDYHREVG
ncbi:MAG TPA: hypothetical protein VIG51_10120 [Candidatus Baltobacteraceae bacterium]|jgi:hypothetical protein